MPKDSRGAYCFLLWKRHDRHVRSTVEARSGRQLAGKRHSHVVSPVYPCTCLAPRKTREDGSLYPFCSMPLRLFHALPVNHPALHILCVSHLNRLFLASFVRWTYSSWLVYLHPGRSGGSCAYPNLSFMCSRAMRCTVILHPPHFLIYHSPIFSPVAILLETTPYLVSFLIFSFFVLLTRFRTYVYGSE